MKTLAAALTSFLLLVTGSTALSAPATPAATPAPAPVPNWYNVELIVYRALDPNAAAQETWPTDPGLPDWNSAQILNPPDSVGVPVPYQLLSPVGEQLDDDWTKLKRSHAYEPLLHVTWTQPALDRASAPAVRIGLPAAAAPAPSSHALPAGVTPPPQATPVFGTAKLSTTGPYLHFDLDLVLQGNPVRAPAAATTGIGTAMPQAVTAAAAVPVYQFYRLQQDRRVDGGKLAYFDHPLFGAILLVTPVRH